MISAVECREHAVECRQMSERAPSPRVRDILIDMARSWERLALETEHSAPTSAKLVLRHQFRARPGSARVKEQGHGKAETATLSEATTPAARAAATATGPLRSSQRRRAWRWLRSTG